MNRNIRLWAVASAIAVISCALPPEPVSLAQARAELRSYLENIPAADARRYRAMDDHGHLMDCLKAIPNQSGNGFFGVYHSMDSGGKFFQVHLATSADLLNWTWHKTLGNQASQPTMKSCVDGGYVVAWEQEPNNHLKFLYYADAAQLLAGISSKSFDAPRQLSNWAEGTPNLYAASRDRVEVGFHYYKNGDVDRQARGQMDWNTWSSVALPDVDEAILSHGVQGNIGDRDGVLDFRGFQFSLIEGQFRKGDFGSWRTFLLDHQTGKAELLNFRTHSGSTAFANPTLSWIAINHEACLLISLYLPREGAKGHEAGELIYYRKVDL